MESPARCHPHCVSVEQQLFSSVRQVHVTPGTIASVTSCHVPKHAFFKIISTGA